MKKNIPEIRFKGYQGEWVVYDASSIFETYYDKNHPNLPVLSASQELGMVVRESVGFQVQHNKENEAGYKRVLPGQFVIHLRSFQGGFAHSKVEGITSPAYTVMQFRSSSEQDDIYWKYVLTSKTFIKRLETVTYGIRDGRSTSFEDFSELDFTFPSVSEQEKIGLFLTTLDKLIAKLEAKLDKLRKLKQALLNKMFINVNGGGYKVPEIRFKGYDEGWTTTVLMELASKMAEKNASRVHKVVLTNSAESGIIDQRHYFEREIVNGNNVQGYYVVQKNDYVYNPRVSTSAPVGPINRNKLGLIGIVSPLYYVFRFNNHAPNFEYLDYFFKSSVWHKFMFTYGNSGARSDRFSISDALFITLPIQHPKAELEQIQIGTALSNLEQVIQKTDLKLTKIRAVKQSLLQKMFA